MTDAQQNPYEGNKVKSMKIGDVGFGTRILRNLKNSNIFHIGDLDNIEVKKSDKSRAYFLNNTETDTNVDRLADQSIHAIQAKLKELGHDGLKGYENMPAQKAKKEKSYKGFSADDFEIVATYSSEHEVCVTLSIPKTFGQLIEDGYVYLDDTLREEHENNDIDENVFYDEALADEVAYDSSAISLIYNTANKGIERMATINITEGFARAVNILMPKAQQRVTDSLEKRYEIKPPKNG